MAAACLRGRSLACCVRGAGLREVRQAAFPWAYARRLGRQALYHRGQRRYDRLFRFLLIDAGAIKGRAVQRDDRVIPGAGGYSDFFAGGEFLVDGIVEVGDEFGDVHLAAFMPRAADMAGEGATPWSAVTAIQTLPRPPSTFLSSQVKKLSRSCRGHRPCFAAVGIGTDADGRECRYRRARVSMSVTS